MALIKFIKELLGKETKVGNILPSGYFLVQQLTAPIPTSKPLKILELGAGTGAVTKQILKSMHPDSTIDIVELNPNFYDKLKDRFGAHHQVRLHHHSALALNELFDPSSFDVVISSLPVSLFPKRDRYRLIGHITRFMKKEAVFVQFHYALRMKRLYEFFFKEVKHQYCFWNIPPAHLFICTNFA